VLGVCAKPRLGGTEEAPPLLGADHLERVAVRLTRLRLDLGEDEPTAPPQDDVELVAGRAGVDGEDAVPAEAIVQARAALAGAARRRRRRR
jgi:hypothetical protein